MAESHGPTESERIAQEAQLKTRNILVASFTLSALMVLHIGFLATRGANVPFLILTLLCWSWVLTGYVFHCLQVIKHASSHGALSYTDICTGTFTFDYLKGCLERERNRALESGMGTAVVYVDMVNIERVNLQFGHTTGDIVLKAMCQVIARNIRPGDILGRIGGDEFLIVMPETKIQDAVGVTGAIGEEVKAYRLDLGKRGSIDYLGCRFGVAAFPAEGQTPDDILAVARERLS